MPAFRRLKLSRDKISRIITFIVAFASFVTILITFSGFFFNKPTIGDIFPTPVVTNSQPILTQTIPTPSTESSSLITPIFTAMPTNIILTVPINESDANVFMPDSSSDCPETKWGLSLPLLEAPIQYYEKQLYDKALACSMYIYALERSKADQDQAVLKGKYQCPDSPSASAMREDYPALNNVGMSLIIAGKSYGALKQFDNARDAFYRAVQDYGCGWVDIDGKGKQNVGKLAASLLALNTG